MLYLKPLYHFGGTQRAGLGDVAVFENRQPVNAAKFINKSSLFILLLGVIRQLELKLLILFRYILGQIPQSIQYRICL